MSQVKSTSFKTALKQEVAYQLENSLGKLKDLLGEKKFNSRVKKATKLITGGIKEGKKSAKATPATKPVKKETVDASETSKVEAKINPAKATPKKKVVTKKVSTANKETEKVLS